MATRIRFSCPPSSSDTNFTLPGWQRPGNNFHRVALEGLGERRGDLLSGRDISAEDDGREVLTGQLLRALKSARYLGSSPISPERASAWRISASRRGSSTPGARFEIVFGEFLVIQGLRRDVCFRDLLGIELRRVLKALAAAAGLEPTQRISASVPQKSQALPRIALGPTRRSRRNSREFGRRSLHNRP